jgi:hypothetical protein
MTGLLLEKTGRMALGRHISTSRALWPEKRELWYFLRSRMQSLK